MGQVTPGLHLGQPDRQVEQDAEPGGEQVQPSSPHTSPVSRGAQPISSIANSEHQPQPGQQPQGAAGVRPNQRPVAVPLGLRKRRQGTGQHERDRREGEGDPQVACRVARPSDGGDQHLFGVPADLLGLEPVQHGGREDRGDGADDAEHRDVEGDEEVVTAAHLLDHLAEFGVGGEGLLHLGDDRAATQGTDGDREHPADHAAALQAPSQPEWS